ncbi:MAG TPA: hypothetical protein VNW92_24160 [Polyangiaceae bacterium]|nr:hypothetical protein [Polyangiaceae bacterium]
MSCVADSQERLIQGLMKNGIEVWRLDVPCALLLRFACLKHRMLCWEPLEVSGIASYLHRDFLERTKTSTVNTLEQALAAINRRHNIGTPRV